MDRIQVGDLGDMEKMRLKRFAKHVYFALLVLTIALTALGIVFGNVESLVLTLPIIVIMCMAIFTDRKSVHIPPMLVIMLMGTFYLTTIARALTESNVPGANILDLASNFLVGLNFGVLGLILVYMLLKSMPKVRGEKPIMVSYFVASSTLSLFLTMKMLQYLIYILWPESVTPVDLEEMMGEGFLAGLGSLVVCLVYYVDEKHNMFTFALTSFLEVNSEYLGIAEREKEDVEKLMMAGESEKLEFKSTLRTNLETGEKDKRMEKAVLKTIVAFLNSDGGTLLIGVKDDGTVLGADVESFDNKDKMGLHLTNLISSQIGNGFLPYISVSMVDFDDRIVVRVVCGISPDPVFLKDGKIEIFYVRSGPQTVELTGMALIDYVDNRRKAGRKIQNTLKRI